MILNRSQTFRKNLRRLGDLIEKNTQIVLLTATLPPRYQSDIFDTLYLQSEKASIYRLPSNRSNIRYSVYMNQSMTEILTKIRDKDSQYSTDRLIVYTRTIDLAKQLAEDLGWPIYHSKSVDKERVLREFLNPLKTSQRIIGTSSLGNGLNSPNIRVVFHVELPYKLYEYAQESGRAGRDDRKSEAILLLSSPLEISTKRYRSKNDKFEDDVIRQYVEFGCRRWVLNLYLDDKREGCISSDVQCDYCSPENEGIFISLFSDFISDFTNIFRYGNR